ncbi:putative triacylglycerol lipase [Dioscorea sansibarensis]
MASNDGSPKGYMIYRPEKAGVIDILSLLLRRKSLSSYKFVETTEGYNTAGVHDDPWVIALTLLIQKTLKAISVPMKWIGYYLEFFLNLLALNGGILGLLWHILTFSLVIPKRDSAEFRSLIGLIDGRVDLYKKSSEMNYFELMYPESSLADTNVLDLSMMASKIAYENPAYVEKTVTDHWKMHFVGFYNCWNKFLNDHTTQAFICCDKDEDASVIVLAFRGTEPFDANDWSTDVDLSWLLSTLKMGNIHLGFLKALGLQNELSFLLGFPKEYSGPADKPVAYYAVREVLRSLIKQHPNAKIIVTGHSLGGALAALFPALLSYHNQSDILNAMYGVMTFGQPRVGDTILAAYMTTIVRLKFHRMVYRFDIVPRIPFDMPPAAMFKHFGTCIYYGDWYKGQVVIDSPNPNYFDPLYMIPMYFWAWIDLLRALIIGQTEGKDFQEGYISILYRMAGLVIPGVASHSPRDYVNAGRLSKIANKIMV